MNQELRKLLLFLFKKETVEDNRKELVLLCSAKDAYIIGLEDGEISLARKLLRNFDKGTIGCKFL